MRLQRKKPGAVGAASGTSDHFQAGKLECSEDNTFTSKFNNVERACEPRFIGDIIAPIVSQICRKHDISPQYARVICANLRIGEDAA